MAVTRKPKPTQTLGDVDVDALIAKGGSVPAPPSEPPPAPAKRDTAKGVLLHIPMPLLGRIDQTLRAQAIKIPRKTWILQAIQEKLARDNPGG